MIVTAAAAQRLAEDPRLMGTPLHTSESAGVMLAAIEPRHANLRFELALEEGVTVLPGPHDPAPIGDLHKQLAHVDAKPHETMRAVALRLHVAHGPIFHPDV